MFRAVSAFNGTPPDIPFSPNARGVNPYAGFGRIFSASEARRTLHRRRDKLSHTGVPPP
jgi:hypothetical protein